MLLAVLNTGRCTETLMFLSGEMRRFTDTVDYIMPSQLLQACFSCVVFTLNCGNCCTTLPLNDCSTFKFYISFLPAVFLKRGKEKEASMTD